MRFTRLWQPRNPRFWLLVALNGLSSAISFILQRHALPTAITWLLVAFAVANVVLGIRVALDLMAREPNDAGVGREGS